MRERLGWGRSRPQLLRLAPGETRQRTLRHAGWLRAWLQPGIGLGGGPPAQARTSRAKPPRAESARHGHAACPARRRCRPASPEAGATAEAGTGGVRLRRIPIRPGLPRRCGQPGTAGPGPSTGCGRGRRHPGRPRRRGSQNTRHRPRQASQLLAPGSHRDPGAPAGKGGGGWTTSPRERSRRRPLRPGGTVLG